jgi:AraC family transcriptional regulator
VKGHPAVALDCSPDVLSAALARKARCGHAGVVQGKTLAEGEGWRAIDYICTCGPGDTVFEERHVVPSVSLVLAGTFACRSRNGLSLLAAGSLLLGAAGQPYECSHQHGEGDRCLSFQFTPELFESLASDAGSKRLDFERDSLPPLRAFAPLAVRALAAIHRPPDLEEIAYGLAGVAVRAGDAAVRRGTSAATRHHDRIAEVLRYLAGHIGELHSVSSLARLAAMSPYYFLRTFKEVTGTTPHQWLLRARLRTAAERLAGGRERITDIALEVGFQDLSNFVRSFRAEFGVSPRAYRAAG